MNQPILMEKELDLIAPEKAQAIPLNLTGFDETAPAFTFNEALQNTLKNTTSLRKTHRESAPLELSQDSKGQSKGAHNEAEKPETPLERASMLSNTSMPVLAPVMTPLAVEPVSVHVSGPTRAPLSLKSKTPSVRITQKTVESFSSESTPAAPSQWPAIPTQRPALVVPLETIRSGAFAAMDPTFKDLPARLEHLEISPARPQAAETMGALWEQKPTYDFTFGTTRPEASRANAQPTFSAGGEPRKAPFMMRAPGVTDAVEKNGLEAAPLQSPMEKTIPLEAPSRLQTPSKDHWQPFQQHSQSRTAPRGPGGDSQRWPVVLFPEPMSATPLDIVSTKHAAAQRALPAAGAPLDPQPVIDQVLNRIDVIQLKEGKPIKIELHPKDLGQVTMQVQVKDHQMTLDVRVESSHVREMVQQAVPEIRQSLSEHGIQLDQFQIQTFDTPATLSLFQGLGTDAKQNTPDFRGYRPRSVIRQAFRERAAEAVEAMDTHVNILV